MIKKRSIGRGVLAALSESDYDKVLSDSKPVEKTESISEESNNNRLSVDPGICKPWKFADRPDNETGHSVGIAASFDKEGQLQPAVVRPYDDPKHPKIRYEVIAGRVRWEAAKAGCVDLDVLVKELNDKEAFGVMVAENEKRKDISDYAKARRYQKALDNRLYDSKQELSKDLDVSSLSRYLGFANLPSAVIDSFENIAEVSVRLGYELSRLCKKDLELKIIECMPKIEAGEIPINSLEQYLVTAKENPQNEKDQSKAAIPYLSVGGRKLFSVRSKRGSDGPTLAFPAAMMPVIDDELFKEIAEIVERRLNSTAPPDGETKDK